MVCSEHVAVGGPILTGVHTMKAGQAFLAGAVGAAVMSLFLWMARTMMGIPANLETMMGTMVADPSTTAWLIGFMIHLMLSGAIALRYAWGLENVTHRSGWLTGVSFSVIHIVIAGVFMGVIPMMHPRMPNPISPPGAFMANLGTMGIAAFVMLHVVYGAIVGAMYGPVMHPRSHSTVGRPLVSASVRHLSARTGVMSVLTAVSRRRACAVASSAACLALAACGKTAELPITAGIGYTPTLPAPSHALIPTINIAKAVRWPAGRTPVVASGLAVAAFASGLDHPRNLYVLPNGDVLVAETNGPPRPDDNTGIKGWFFKYFQRKGGGAAPSANRIILLRDTNADGVADQRFTFLDGLRSPYGMALVGSDLVVANTDALVRYKYHEGDTVITAAATQIVALPAGTINHHWTKNVVASPDGSTLFLAVGSNSNAAENGMAVEAERAAVWAVDMRSGAHRIVASGLRNPVGMAWEPGTGALWVAVNERDELGNNLVPDYMTAIRDGAFYGWPYSYFGQHLDERVKPTRSDLVSNAITPDYALGSHTASLGLAWSDTDSLLPMFSGGMFVGQHGSWNRKPASGYKVIYVPFSAGRPSGLPTDVLTGFLGADGTAMGRPVGVALDKRGGVLVADDVGNTVWRVSSAVAR